MSKSAAEGLETRQFAGKNIELFVRSAFAVLHEPHPQLLLSTSLCFDKIEGNTEQTSSLFVGEL